MPDLENDIKKKAKTMGKKVAKKEELSFLSPEISNSAEFDKGRCPLTL